MTGRTGGGTEGIDNDFFQQGFHNLGAWILGRNMFSPYRGPWEDHEWTGWWEDNPPYHVPVFILTHYARPPLVMQGGTTFHFVTGGIHEALEQAKQAAAGKDIRVGGGVSVIRQYLHAQLIDELHLAIAPVFLGSGENLFAGLDLPALGYSVTAQVAAPAALHISIAKQ
jgi:dihydrofolate reductase